MRGFLMTRRSEKGLRSATKYSRDGESPEALPSAELGAQRPSGAIR
jgi:hypothetical protein